MKKNGERFDAILGLIDDIVAHPDKYPDRFIPIPLKDNEITEIFTKRRIQLIKLIKEKQPVTVTELAELTGRNVSGVIRDISMLKEFHIVGAERKGKEINLSIKQDFLIIPIVSTFTLKEIEKRKELAVA
ncbi:MAG: HTH domain-containing protein [Candidatus Micrarchaeota archaeon]|nr:HTH domain-containing protein [Candidatus Micrarchaeota archaeon]